MKRAAAKPNPGSTVTPMIDAALKDTTWTAWQLFGKQSDRSLSRRAEKAYRNFKKFHNGPEIKIIGPAPAEYWALSKKDNPADVELDWQLVMLVLRCQVCRTKCLSDECELTGSDICQVWEQANRLYSAAYNLDPFNSVIMETRNCPHCHRDIIIKECPNCGKNLVVKDEPSS